MLHSSCCLLFDAAKSFMAAPAHRWRASTHGGVSCRAVSFPGVSGWTHHLVSGKNPKGVIGSRRMRKKGGKEEEREGFWSWRARPRSLSGWTAAAGEKETGGQE